MCRFRLETYNQQTKNRYDCPNCGKRRIFVRYVDTRTNEHIAPNVGKCNRLNNCGYHLTPKQYFQENKPLFEPQIESRKIVRPKKIHSLIPDNCFIESLKHYENNNFVQFLLQQFGNDITDQLIKKYFIGTSKHWKGATVFWQIARGKKIRTGKIMLYNPITGNRVKEPYNHITWVHSVLKIPDTKQCFFGEHLLSNDLDSPVAIVESEKTALITSVYLPEFIWLACGGVNGLNIDNCKVLKGRKVILYPDLNCFELWSKKAKELSDMANFTVSDFLELKASEIERKLGLDLADYLL